MARHLYFLFLCSVCQLFVMLMLMLFGGGVNTTQGLAPSSCWELQRRTGAVSWRRGSSLASLKREWISGVKRLSAIHRDADIPGPTAAFTPVSYSTWYVHEHEIIRSGLRTLHVLTYSDFVLHPHRTRWQTWSFLCSRFNRKRVHRTHCVWRKSSQSPYASSDIDSDHDVP
jgi:hypothetical protein